MNLLPRSVTLGAAATAAILSFAAGAYLVAGGRSAPTFGIGAAAAPETGEPDRGPTPPPDSVELAGTQLQFVKVEAAELRDFPIEKIAIGSIDFNEEMLTQVFTPNQGRIVGLFAKVGDEVRKGDTVFTIDSPDLVQLGRA
jgi:cobalt-zinc-cadmium efflux system membrane fusion protein